MFLCHGSDEQFDFCEKDLSSFGVVTICILEKAKISGWVEVGFV